MSTTFVVGENSPTQPPQRTHTACATRTGQLLQVESLIRHDGWRLPGLQQVTDKERERDCRGTEDRHTCIARCAMLALASTSLKCSNSQAAQLGPNTTRG